MSIEEFHNILDNGVQQEREIQHRGDPEHRLQCTMITWFDNVYRGHIIAAIPNGGKRNLITAKKLKEEGVRAGIPDLLIPESNGEYNCLWIEVKNGKKGVLNPNQKIMHERLRGKGNKVEVARTLDDFIQIVNTYFGHGKDKNK